MRPLYGYRSSRGSDRFENGRRIASFASVGLLLFAAAAAHANAADPPNIVWLIGEDMGPDLGCWGAPVHTPHLDGLAAQGMRFRRVFGTASVCMPNRTAMITGVTQSSLGSVTMRPPKRFQRALPDGVAPLPELLRRHGYFTGNIRDGGMGAHGKDDWNFLYEGPKWDTNKLADLPKNQPFYAQFNFPEAHRPHYRDQQHPIDAAAVNLPPYYPDHPVARRAWADYLESIQLLDRKVGRVLAWLDEQGLADNTIVFFLSDHGEAFLRGKYFLYDCSLNQPVIVRWPAGATAPDGYEAGAVSDRLTAAIDLAPETLRAAGIAIPDWMHGRPFIGGPARDFVYSAADWIGGAQPKSRSVRTDTLKYIRNFNTDISVHSASTEYRKALHPLYPLVDLLAARDELSPLHRALLVDNLVDEELYDLRSDPHELVNLVEDPTYAGDLKSLRELLAKSIEATGDLGLDELDPDHAEYFRQYRRDQARSQAAAQRRLREKVEAQLD